MFVSAIQLHQRQRNRFIVNNYNSSTYNSTQAEQARKPDRNYKQLRSLSTVACFISLRIKTYLSLIPQGRASLPTKAKRTSRLVWGHGNCPQPVRYPKCTKRLQLLSIGVLFAGLQRSRFYIEFRNGLGQPFFNGLKIRIVRQIMVFSRVNAMVIQFFTAIAVADIAKLSTSNRVIFILPRRHDRGTAFQRRITQLRG